MIFLLNYSRFIYFTSMNQIVSTFSFYTDMSGINCVIIDTSKSPWIEFVVPLLDEVVSETPSKEESPVTKQVKTYEQVYANGLNSGLFNKETLPATLLAGYERRHAESLNYTETDSDGELVIEKVSRVERIVLDFAQMYLLYSFLLKKGLKRSIGKYDRLFDFVVKHTSGPIHDIAKKFVQSNRSE